MKAGRAHRLATLAAFALAAACASEGGEGAGRRDPPAAPAVPITAGPQPVAKSPIADASVASETGRTVTRPIPDSAVGNVYLIVVDTMRADVTSLFPGGFEATPFLLELARKGVLYTQAYSTSSWTVPAMYSVMTGLYPSQHGMVRGGVRNGAVVRQSMLPEQALTLAEQLRDLGYDTYAVCTNQHLAGKYGMAQGFRRFAGEGFSKLPFGEFAIGAMSGEMLAAGRRFVWLHYFDPHHPYGAIHPWFERWNDSGFDDYGALALDAAERIYRERNGLPSDAPLPFAAIDGVHDAAASMRWTNPVRYFAAYQGRSGPPREGTKEARYAKFLRAAYASEVRATDESIRRVAGRLRFGEDDLVIVVSDHGEEFLEHGHVGHRFFGSVSQELIHVPLLIKYPGNRRGGTAVSDPVSLVDLVPTVRGVLGQPPLQGLPGRDLSAGTDPRRAVFGELTEGGAELRFAVEPPWKLVRNERNRKRLLFDLGRDPGERADASGTRPEILMRLEAGLSEWLKTDVAAWPAGPSARLSEVELQRLDAMGYVQ